MANTLAYRGFYFEMFTIQRKNLVILTPLGLTQSVSSFFDHSQPNNLSHRIA